MNERNTCVGMVTKMKHGRKKSVIPEISFKNEN